MKKKPELKDLMNWLNEIRSDWSKLAVQLEVKGGTIKELAKNGGLDDKDRLHNVLDEWERTMCSPYTFENLLTCLEEESVGEGKCAETVREQLRKPEVQARYRK